MLFVLFLCLLDDIAAAQTSTTVANPVTTVPAEDCDTCFLVAPIDEALFGSEASYYIPLGVFTYFIYSSTGTIEGPSLVVFPSATVVTYNNHPITDPTFYNVFRMYTSFTQTRNAAGSCVTSLVTAVVLPIATSIPLPPIATSNVIAQAEESFINEIGGLDCKAASVTVNSPLPGATNTTGITEPPTTLTVTLPGQLSATPTGSNDTHATPTNNSTGIASNVASDDQGLSQSAKLGIGIGVGVSGAIILVLIGVFIWKRCTRKRHMREKTDPLSELPSREHDSLAELENKIPPQELENNVPPQELSAGSPLKSQRDQVL